MLCKCLYPEIFDILLRYHFMDCAQASWESCFRCGAWVRILAVPPPVRTKKKTTPRSMIRDGFFIDAESYGEALRLSCSFWTTKPGCKLGRKKTEEVISWHTDFLLVDLWKVYLKTRGLFFDDDGCIICFHFASSFLMTFAPGGKSWKTAPTEHF